MIKKWSITFPAHVGRKKRNAYVYIPDAAFENPEERYPVLYMFDGHNVFFDEDATYGKSWGMKEFLDYTEIPMIVAAVECNHHPDNGRLSEYSPYTFRDHYFGHVTGRGRTTMEWMVNTFKPYIDRHYPTLPDREHTFICGSSMGGLMSLTGQRGNPPTRAGCAMGDILGGLNLTIGVLAALNARTVTGHGQRVDVALTDCVVASLEQAVQRYAVSGKLPERNGNSYAAIAPYDTYEAKDGHLVIGCGNQKLFEVLFRDLIKKPEVIDDPRFADVPLRVKNNLILKEYIEEWTKQYTVDEAVEIVLNAGIPAGPINDLSDTMNDENFTVDREMIIKTHHPVMGDITLNGNPVKLMDTMPEIYKPSPTLGEDTEDIFAEFLGMNAEDVAALKEKGII